MVKPREDLKDPGSSPTIPQKATVAHNKQANEKHIKACQNFENDSIMDEAINQQVIEVIEENHITEIRNK